MRRPTISFFALLFLLIAGSFNHAAFAEPPVPPALSGNGVIGPAAPPAPHDTMGRETPKALIQGFLRTVGNENYEHAAAYLDLGGLAPSRQKSKGPGLAKDLQTLLDQGGWVEAESKLSDSPEGNQNDGLAQKVDRVGRIRNAEKSVDLLAERSDDPEFGPIWRISKETVAAIPDLLDEMAIGPLDRILPLSLIDNKWYGVPVGHWLAISALAVVVFLPAWILTIGVISIIHIVWPASRRGHAHRILKSCIIPIKIYIALGTFAVFVRVLGISIIARQNFMFAAGIVAWLSLCWLLWNIIDVIARVVEDRMSYQMRRSALSFVIFFRRSARLALAAIAITVAMNQMGLDVTAWFAALGIGGLALAFGAKTTFENFVVGLTLILDQPLRVGDFCKVGETKGTVEDIGMRSTRIRTPENTTVTIPNATLSNVIVENYSQRAKFLFNPTLALRSDTTPEQMRQLLAALQEFLINHPHVERGVFRARFISLGKDSLNVEIFCYIVAKEHAEFLITQEGMLLRIMEIVTENGTGFAFSSTSQRIYITQESGSKAA